MHKHLWSVSLVVVIVEGMKCGMLQRSLRAKTDTFATTREDGLHQRLFRSGLSTDDRGVERQ